MFIARISRGRTIRQFVTAELRRQLAESVVTRSIRVAVNQHQGETSDMVTATNKRGEDERKSTG